MGKYAVLLIAFAVIFTTALQYSTTYLNDLNLKAAQSQKKVFELEQNVHDAAYENHLKELDSRTLEETKRMIEEQYAKLEAEFNTFKSDATQQKLIKIENIHASYQEILSKNDRNHNLSLDTTLSSDVFKDWGKILLDEHYDELQTTLNTTEQTLEAQYTQYLASLPTPTPKPIVLTSAPVAGYSYQTVSNERGSFGVYLIKMSLAEVQVRTVTANSDNCTNNCPAKSLADYIGENGAYAGMNGSYFCPPDYASCASKTYSYDFGVYNTNLGKWLNQPALSWNDVGLAAFNGSTAKFYKDSKNYTGSFTAGVSNFPSLLENGNIAVNPAGLTSYQRDVRGARGAIGTDGSNVYLAIANGATVPDMAYIMRSLGATDSLNLDGGGSSALYINGSYKVGPGRQLPNAILLVK